MNAEELLRELLKYFYVSGPSEGLEWGYQEGYTIGEIAGKEFEQELKTFLSKETAEKLITKTGS